MVWFTDYNEHSDIHCVSLDGGQCRIPSVSTIYCGLGAVWTLFGRYGQKTAPKHRLLVK